jgi:hypothetical protein
MKQEHVNLLSSKMLEFFEEYADSQGDVLSFVSTSFVGTMENCGFSQEFMDDTCDRMKLAFMKKRILSNEKNKKNKHNKEIK